MIRVFVVEDDQAISGGIARELTQWGFEVICAAHFDAVTQDFKAAAADIVLMDISLPYFNGFYWCAEIRKISDVPIVFLSCNRENIDIVTAMNMGADDYICKPFSTDVLNAKLRAILRRAGRAFSPSQSTVNGAYLDMGASRIICGDTRIELTRNELGIMELLFRDAGKIVTREQLMLRLWDGDEFVDDNTLTVNINRLRHKLEGTALEGTIVTRKGMGYSLEVE